MIAQRLSLALGLVAVLLATSCSSWESKMRSFRNAWHSSEIEMAEAELDSMLAGQLGASASQLASEPDLVRRLDIERGNAVLLALEKSMLRLAQGDVETAEILLGKARDYYNVYVERNIADWLKGLADDESRTYVGHDHEALLIRVVSALADLLGDGDQALAQALSIDALQERLISSDFGSVEGEKGYRPRKLYERLPIGSYLAGLALEADVRANAAKTRFEQALAWAPHKPKVLEDAIERTTRGQFAPRGHGALHVVYFGGRGPFFAETRSRPTELALRLAGIGVAIFGRAGSALIQTAVPVPVTVVSDTRIPAMTLRAGELEVATERLVDVNQVVAAQLKANMPWILARAVIRRSIKLGAAVVTERAVRKETKSGAAGFFAGLLVNLVSTAGERAETRCWSTLPAEIQVARLELSAGQHEIELGDGSRGVVRIRPGRNSWLLVVQPDLRRPAFVVVDKASGVAAKELPKAGKQ